MRLKFLYRLWDILLTMHVWQMEGWMDNLAKKHIPPKAKKKIGVFTVCRPTLFYSCRPYHFFSENKKKTRQFSGPASVVPDFSTGIQNFRWFYSIWYVVKPFTDTFGFCQSKMQHSRRFFFQNKCDHHDQKSLFEATSHHQMTWDI